MLGLVLVLVLGLGLRLGLGLGLRLGIGWTLRIDSPNVFQLTPTLIKLSISLAY